MADHPNCLDTGKCSLHDVEIERRKSDRKDVEYLKGAVIKMEKAISACAEAQNERTRAFHQRMNTTENKVFGIFVSLGLMAVILFGGYYYATIIDKRNDRGEEILLAKINSNDAIAKAERAETVAQVVTLLTSDAEQREWQKGMMKQMELLNTHIEHLIKIGPIGQQTEWE